MISSTPPLIADHSTFCIPSVIPIQDTTQHKLGDSIQKIYQFCLSSQKPMRGTMLLSFVIDLSKRDVQILDSKGERVKVNKLSTTSYTEDGRCVTLKWAFNLKDRVETYITTRDGDSLNAPLFDGMEYERVFPANTEFPIPPKKFWDQWEEIIPQEVQHYNKVIYPKIIETIGKIQTLQGKNLDVLDIGGGSGSLAVKLLDQLPGKIKKITVIDGSNRLLQQAAIKGKKHTDLLTTRCIDLTKPDPLLIPELANTADVIILCGVVAHQVLNQETGQKVVRACLPILKEHGFMIAASLSPALLNSEEYESMGFRVLNKSYSFWLNRGPYQLPYATNDFYILQKNQ